MEIIELGLDQFIAGGYIFLRPDNSEAKKQRKAAAAKGVLINATAGRKTRCVIVSPVNQVILSPRTLKTHRARFEQSGSKDREIISAIEGVNET